MLYVIGNYAKFDHFADHVQSQHPELKLIRSNVQLDEMVKELKETGQTPFYACFIHNLTREQFEIIKGIDPCPITMPIMQDQDNVEPEDLYNNSVFKPYLNLSLEVAQLDPFAIKTVRLGFNSGNLDIFKLKLHFARAIDTLIQLNRDPVDVRATIEQILLAQMRAVHLLTGDAYQLEEPAEEPREDATDAPEQTEEDTLAE